MSYTIRNEPDGLQVYDINEIQTRIDPKTDKPLAPWKYEGTLVHATEIARFYGIDLQDVGVGDNRIPGIWSLVHSNTIGRRVDFNNGEVRDDARLVRKFTVIRDNAGNPTNTEEKIVAVPMKSETDDGMYVTLTDLRRYAKAMGWEKGKGNPQIQTHRKPEVDIAKIVAAVLAALKTQDAIETPPLINSEAAEVKQKVKRVLTDEHKAALAAGRERRYQERKAAGK